MSRMTQARMAEIISLLREERHGEEAMDLFEDWAERSDCDTRQFAEQCGFPIATNVRLVEELRDDLTPEERRAINEQAAKDNQIDFDENGQLSPLSYEKFDEVMISQWVKWQEATDEQKRMLYVEYREAKMGLVEFFDGAHTHFDSVLDFLKECAAGAVVLDGEDDTIENCWSVYEPKLRQKLNQYFEPAKKHYAWESNGHYDQHEIDQAKRRVRLLGKEPHVDKDGVYYYE